MTNELDFIVNTVISESKWAKAGIQIKEDEKPVEAEKVEEAKKEEVKKVEEAEVHTCPLCESKLATPISDEKLEEHVATIARMLEEVSEEGVEEIEEELEEDSEEEEKTEPKEK